MKDRRKKKTKNTGAGDGGVSHRNQPIYIPLSFDAAVEGLLSVKPKKKPSDGKPPK